MKIDSIKPPGLNGPGRPAAKAAPAAATPANGGEVGDVHLSSASAALSAQEPTVNMARVKEIRAAIAEGRFEINASAIADRLISTARELVDTQRRA